MNIIITNRFAEEERSLREDQRRRMDEFMQRKRRSMTSSPVGNHKLSSDGNASGNGIKVRLKQQHNFVTVPTSSPQAASYTSSQSYVQHQYHQHNHHTGWTPEGENMERKVKQALMTEFSSKPKPSGKSDTSTKLHLKTDSSRLHSKSTVLQQSSQQGVQGYRPSASTSTWPGDDFHMGSNLNTEMTPEPLSTPANSKPDVSEFDPIETKNK